MKKIFTFIVALCCIMASWADSNYYGWSSPAGTVVEYGGKLEQHNEQNVNLINYRTSGFYTIYLMGKCENLHDEDNSPNSVYFTITLAEGNTFKAGDSITISAMRNNDDGGRATLYFEYSNGTTVADDTAWDNLGQKHETTIGGSTGVKSLVPHKDYGIDDVEEYSLYPSTSTLIVPDEADGSTSLRLTRNASECMLYITSISIKHAMADDIATVADTEKANDTTYDLSGRPCPSSRHGIIIRNGKKYINNK